MAKAVEGGQLLPPRLPLLIRMAEVLDVADLADVTGEQRLSASSYSKVGHESPPAVAAGLAGYAVSEQGEPTSAEQLDAQVRQAWTLWHGSRRQRTAVAVVLPSLITPARTSRDQAAAAPQPLSRRSTTWRSCSSASSPSPRSCSSPGTGR